MKSLKLIFFATHTPTVGGLLRDLEGKGIVRTAVETTNLAISSNNPDVMHAECIRTFPSVTFPAVLLLRREEVETGKTKGASIIAAVGAAGGAFSRRAYMEAPFDLMYGFRGRECFVELLSPYEMLMHWSMEQVHPPIGKHKGERSEFTEEGLRYKEDCARNSCVPHYEAGKHYISTPANGRLLMPSHPALGVLRHKWVWERRPRPYVPVELFQNSQGQHFAGRKRTASERVHAPLDVEPRGIYGHRPTSCELTTRRLFTRRYSRPKFSRIAEKKTPNWQNYDKYGGSEIIFIDLAAIRGW